MTLRPADQKVVRASRVLTGDQKLLLIDTAALDRGPEHAYISAERQALRLGLTEDYVKKTRSHFRKLGLLSDQRRTCEVLWRAEWMPAGKRPSDEEAVRLAGVFDAFLAAATERARTAPSGAVAERARTAPRDAMIEGAQIALSTGGNKGGQIAP